jgi:dTDP-D-glucose 4,6-dehydratase
VVWAPIEYGPQPKITEQTPLSPTTLYGTAKICAYLLAKQLLAQNQRRFLWLRIFSTYGPKDNPSWMIPYLIQTLMQGKKPSLTACEQKWDYLYAGDVASAIYLAAVQEQTEGVYNIGSGQAVSLCSIVEQLRDLVDPSLPLGIGDIPYRPDQVMHLEADISRLQQATGWSPQFTLAEGLQRTVAWYKAQPKNHGSVSRILSFRFTTFNPRKGVLENSQAALNEVQQYTTRLARRVRRQLLHMVHCARASHIGSCLSCVDILSVLYGKILRLDPQRPDWPDRDRLS